MTAFIKKPSNFSGVSFSGLKNHSATGGTTVPASGTSGFSPGCIFNLTGAASGQCGLWENIGTASSCLFVPIGPVTGYGVRLAGQPVTSAGGDTTETITNYDFRASTDISFVEHCITNDTDTIVAQALTDGTITITGSADPSTAHKYAYAVLANKCVPAYDIVAAGSRDAITADTTAAAITVAAALAGDIAFATYNASDDTDVIAAVAAGAGAVNLTLSADPLLVHGYNYVVFRPRGSFKPSHFIFAAGVATTVGGAAAEAITIAGAKSTDLAIVHYNTTNDTDTIVKAVMTANTLTVTMSADPSTAHALAYMILRAYA